MYGIRLSAVLVMGALFAHLTPGISTDLAPAYNTNDECYLDEDGMSLELKTCLDKGYNFIQMFIKHMKKDRRRAFDKCGEFYHFGRCINPLLERCPSIRRELHRHWLHVVDSVNCYCSGNTTCVANIDCFEKEMSNTLVERCDAVYKFNIKQQTRPKCFFLRENINCKDALVTSSCGNASGEFAYHMLKVAARGQINTRRCFIPRDHSYQGFRYGEGCPSDLLDQIHQCRYEHLTRDKLDFYEANDLVAQGGKKAVKKACRGFRQYHRCVREISSTCPHGVRYAHEHDGLFRTYLMKMDYICNNAEVEYRENLRCYQDVLANRTYSQCEYIWSEMQPLLKTVTSYKYFCKERINETLIFEEDLTRVRMCYEEVFKTSCGMVGSKVLGELIVRAFDDPLYLRLTYKADCQLHKEPLPPTTTTVTTTTTTSTTTQPSMRSTESLTVDVLPPLESNSPQMSSGSPCAQYTWILLIPWLTVSLIHR